MSDRYARIIVILTELRDLLNEWEWFGQGQVVSDVLDLAHLESPDFVPRLQGGEIWGGSGSVADIGRIDYFVQRSKEEGTMASRRLTQLLVELGDEMEEHGIADEGSRFVTAVFRKGLTEDWPE